jgi:hypothetical protein
MNLTVLAHEIGVVYIRESLRVSEVEIFPYGEVHDRKKYNGVCPKRGDKYKR